MQAGNLAVGPALRNQALARGSAEFALGRAKLSGKVLDFFIARGKLLENCPKSASVGSVARLAFDVLTGAFQCRLMGRQVWAPLLSKAAQHSVLRPRCRWPSPWGR